MTKSSRASSVEKSARLFVFRVPRKCYRFSSCLENDTKPCGFPAREQSGTEREAARRCPSSRGFTLTRGGQPRGEAVRWLLGPTSRRSQAEIALVLTHGVLPHSVLWYNANR